MNDIFADKIAYEPTGKVSYRDYMFLASMIKVRSREMITFERLEQILMSGDSDTAAKMLAESGWPNMSGMSGTEIDEALTAYRNGIFRDIALVCPEDQLIEIFRLKYDYHNAKTIIKSEGAGINAAELFSDAGRIPAEKLSAAHRDNDFRFMPEILKEALQESKAVLARTQNPQLSDHILDTAYFREMEYLAGQLEPNTEPATLLIDPEASIPFMSYYRGMLIDIANLRTCVRCLRMGRDESFLKTYMLEGGNIFAETMARAAFSGDGFVPVFNLTPLAKAAELAAAASKGALLTAFEKECDDAVMRWLADRRLMYFGPELVTWYLAVTETLVVDARMILKGLKAGIGPDILRERLRETYE